MTAASPPAPSTVWLRHLQPRHESNGATDDNGETKMRIAREIANEAAEMCPTEAIRIVD